MLQNHYNWSSHVVPSRDIDRSVIDKNNGNWICMCLFIILKIKLFGFLKIILECVGHP